MEEGRWTRRKCPDWLCDIDNAECGQQTFQGCGGTEEKRGGQSVCVFSG